MRAAVGIPFILSRQDRREGRPRGPAPDTPCGSRLGTTAVMSPARGRVCALPEGWLERVLLAASDVSL